MKYELTASRKLEPIYLPTDFWERILNSAAAYGWAPAMPEKCEGPVVAYSRSSELAKYDAVSLGAILTRWAASPRDFTDQARMRQLAEWLGKAGDVTITPSMPWDADRRLQGIRRVTLKNCLGRGPTMGRMQFYETLNTARRWGWRHGEASNGEYKPDDLRRGPGFDCRGAVMAALDAEQLAAVLKVWRPVLGSPVLEDVPIDVRHIYELIRAVAEGVHRGSGWIQIVAE